MSSRDLVVAAAGASAPSDPQFKNVSLLLSGDGTNGAQNNTFLDSSTNNFTITRSGNTTQGTFSPYGNLWSNYFDGTGDYLTVPDNAALQPPNGDFTYEIWWYPTSLSGTQELFTKGTGVQIYLSGGVMNCALSTNNSSTYFIAASFGTPTLNAWNHIAVVRSGTNYYGYLNGARTTLGTSSSYPGTGTDNVVIGAYAAGLYPTFGYLSNARYTTSAVYTTSPATVPTSPLTAISGTQLLTCQSNRFIDNSSNNFTITRNGDVSVQRFSPFNPTAPYSASTIGGSGYFDGSGDYLSVPDNAAFNFGTGDFTIEMWAYSSTTQGAYAGLITFTTDGGNGLGVGFGNGDNKLRIIWSNTQTILASSAMSNTTWTHVALVRSGATVTLYQNGLSVGTYNIGSSAMPYINVGGAIGRLTTNTNNYYFNGYISNLRIVKGTAVYTSNFTTPTAPLTAITNTSLLLNFTNAGIPDAAMMNNLETVGNAQVSTSVKKYGTGSLAFDGSGDSLKAASNPSLAFGTGAYTVEFWIYWNALGGGEIISTTNNFGTGYWTFYDNGSVVSVASTGGVGSMDYTWTGRATGTWYHVAISRESNSTQRLFINGTQVVSGTYTNNFEQNGLQVGDGFSADFNGYIDDLRITKGYARYTANFTPPAQALPTN